MPFERFGFKIGKPTPRLDLLNGKIEELNREIDRYNRQQGSKIKKEALLNIKKLKQEMDDLISYRDNFDAFLDYLTNKLPNAIREAESALGLESPLNLQDPSYADFLNAFTPEMLHAFTEYLKDTTNNEVYQKFFALIEQDSVLLPMYAAVYTKYGLPVCAHNGNTMVFKINTTEGVAHILRIEKGCEPRFQAITANKGVLTPIASFIVPGSDSVMRVQVVPYCSGGDLASELEKSMSNEERLEKALDRFEKYLEMVAEWEDRGCAQTDMKNSNILINNDELVVADNKAFYAMDEFGNVTLGKNEFVFLTFRYSPQELLDTTSVEVRKKLKLSSEEPPSKVFNAKRVHSYIAAADIYEYLVNPQEERYFLDRLGKSWDYDHPIFKSKEGREIEVLIRKLAEDRQPVAEALAEIRKNKLHKELQETLSNLASKFTDPSIATFCQEYQDKIKICHDLGELRVLDKEIREISTAENPIDRLAIRELTQKCSKILQDIRLSMGESNAFCEDCQERLNTVENKESCLKLLAEITSIHTSLKESQVSYCKTLLEDINQKSIGTKDEHTQNFYNTFSEKLSNATTLKEWLDIREELERIHSSVHSPEMQAIRKGITDIEGNKYILQKKEKLAAIYTALAKIPLEDRAHAFNNNELQNAFATKGSIFAKSFNPTTANTGNTSDSFKKIKSQVEALREREREQRKGQETSKKTELHSAHTTSSTTVPKG